MSRGCYTRRAPTLRAFPSKGGRLELLSAHARLVYRVPLSLMESSRVGRGSRTFLIIVLSLSYEMYIEKTKNTNILSCHCVIELDLDLFVGSSEPPFRKPKRKRLQHQTLRYVPKEQGQTNESKSSLVS